MKTIKHLIILSLVAFLSFACKKTINNGKQYTVEGRFMYNCETPASNEEFSFRQGSPGLIEIKDPLMRVVKTDADGYFKIVYNGKESNGSAFRIMKSGDVMVGIPSRENIDLGNVYFNVPQFSFILNIEVSNAYTNLDTLHYYDWNYPQNGAEHWMKKIPGPFESGVLDTVWNCIYMNSTTYGEDPLMNVSYFINDFQANRKEANFPITEFCSDQLYEAVIKVE